MKKLVLIAALCVATISTYAQKGTWEIMGTASLSTGKLESGSSMRDDTKLTGTIFSIVPCAFYNISDKWAVGLGIGYFGGKSDATDGLVNTVLDVIGSSQSNSALSALAAFSSVGDVKISGFNIRPGVRYKQPISGRFSWAPIAQIGYSRGNVDVDVTYNNRDMTIENSMDIFIGAVRFGRFEVNINRHWDLSFEVGSIEYRHLKVEGDDNAMGELLKRNTFKIKLLDNTAIGIGYRF